jgi:hypothetical protein
MLFLNRKAEIQILCGLSSDQIQDVLNNLFDEDRRGHSSPESREGSGRNGLVEYVVERIRRG